LSPPFISFETMRVSTTLCVVLCLVAAVAATDTMRARRTEMFPRFTQLFAHAQGTKCATLHCPYDNAVCCPGKGGRAPTCCPSGYQCAWPHSGPTTCVFAKHKTSKNGVTTIRPTLVINPSSPISGMAGGSGSAQPQGQQSMAQSQLSLTDSPLDVTPGGSQQGLAASASNAPSAPKFRQNIIIVKNINVLTKLQQVKDGKHHHGSSSRSSASGSSASPTGETTAASAVTESAGAAQSRFGQLLPTAEDSEQTEQPATEEAQAEQPTEDTSSESF